MASEYRQIFPSELVFENMKWRLIYDPANPVMVKPDLSHSKVVRYTCDAVKLSGQDNPFYLATLNIVIPAQPQNGDVVTMDRMLLGVRIYPQPIAGLAQIKPAELLYYVAEPVFGTEGSRAQTLFNLLIGQAYEESKKQDETVDRVHGGMTFSVRPPSRNKLRRGMNHELVDRNGIRRNEASVEKGQAIRPSVSDCPRTAFCCRERRDALGSFGSSGAACPGIRT